MKRIWIFWILLLLHALSLGLTDDEAYYWVLAQNLQLGYAFHPPGIAYAIRFFQEILAPFFGDAFVPSLRVLAVGMSLGIYLLSIRVVQRAHQIFENSGAGEARVSPLDLEQKAALLALPGFYGLSWMMVPDLPLFFSGAALVVFTLEWIAKKKQRDAWPIGVILAGMSLSVAGVLLSKFSGVLWVVSAMVVWTVFRVWDVKWAVFFTLGLALGWIPPLWWNAQNEWAALIYQFGARHGGASFSPVRWVGFVSLQILIAGPVWVIWFFREGLGWAQTRWKAAGLGLQLGRAPSILEGCKNLWMSMGIRGFFWIWILPPAGVFLLQPFFSPYKPHWAFAAWWPFVLLSVATGGAGDRRWVRAQTCFSWVFMAIFALTSHFPWINWTRKNLGYPTDAKYDLAFDLLGWEELPQQVHEKLGDEFFSLPVTGFRYQTTSQAAFSWSRYFQQRDQSVPVQYTMVPQDTQSDSDWPDLPDVMNSVHHGWPQLKKPVLYVADGRYGDGPQFLNSSCVDVFEYSPQRWGISGKTIKVWKCFPSVLNGSEKEIRQPE